MRFPFGRRAFLAFSAVSILRSQTGNKGSSVFTPQHFLDPATELDLYRLTEPQSDAILPASHLRFISRRGRFLIYTSNRSGSNEIYRLDWHSGESRQLTTGSGIDPGTPALSADDRFFFYFSGPNLKQTNVGNLREREIARVADGWERAPGFSLSPDGSTAVWVERRGDESRLRRVQTAQGQIETVVSVQGLVSDPQIRPGHPHLLYRIADNLQLTSLTGGPSPTLALEPDGSPGQALWSRDGRTLLYLSIPHDVKQLTTLREFNPEEHSDKLIAKTSQFASFGLNGDASVFVGASRSLASPYILLLLRVARRELTLCEHRSTDPTTVNPVFSPDSQNIFFTSNRKGKQAIYRLHVERFVEETEDEPG